MPSCQKPCHFLLLCFSPHSQASSNLQFMWLLKHLWICLFAWVTNICFPVLFIHIWEPFMMELIHWQILNMFHLKELQSDPSCKEVGKVQFLLLGYCSLFLKLHLRCVICSDEILQRNFWLSKPDLETVIRTEVSQKEEKKITKYPTLMHISGIQKNDTDELICKAETETQIQRTNVWTPKGQGGWDKLGD